MSRITRKPVFGVSDQVQHKRGCTATEDGKRLEKLDLGHRGIVLCSKNIGAAQLCGYHAANLLFCFAYTKTDFLMAQLK